MIGISLALPAGFYLLLENARLLTSELSDSANITVFLKTEVDISTATSLAKRLQEEEALIINIQVIDREQALKEYQRLSGITKAIAALEENPLPTILAIKPALSISLSDTKQQQLLDLLENNADIEMVQYDQKWVKRLQGIIKISHRFVWIITLFISLAVLLVVGNTIRMFISNHRHEIEITKLFGAKDSFIQRPFLYTGFWYGLTGGIFAWAFISLSLLFLIQPVNKLAMLYSAHFSISMLSTQETLVLLACGCLLGLLGSWISVQRHLRLIEPT